MAKQARPAAARPPRASVPAFGGWEVAAAAGGSAAAADYSLDFTAIRAARMQRRTKALSWSSFVAEAEARAPGGGEEEEEVKRQWWPSAAAASDRDDDGRQRPPRLRRLRSDDDDRQPIRPGRPAPKGRSKFKGYLFGCVAG